VKPFTAPVDTAAVTPLGRYRRLLSWRVRRGPVDSRPLARRYRLVSPIGRGATSVVWYAEDLRLGRFVAVKILTEGEAAAAREHALAEARAAARLSHPNVAVVHDYGEVRVGWEKIPYLVMEYVRGPTLADELSLGPLADWATAVRVCGNVAGALSAVHSAGLVHRDVKPRNVILAPAGVKIVDFGVAVTGGAPARSVSGTPLYMAPEQLRGDSPSPAGDMYSFGLVFYQCLTGTLPWPPAAMRRRRRGLPVPAARPLPALPGVPESVSRLCDACLRVSPAQRPTSAQAARTLLEVALPRPGPVRRTASQNVTRPHTVRATVPAPGGALSAPGPTADG
jgi:serine/threonine protein kinase